MADINVAQMTGAVKTAGAAKYVNSSAPSADSLKSGFADMIQEKAQESLAEGQQPSDSVGSYTKEQDTAAGQEQEEVISPKDMLELQEAVSQMLIGELVSQPAEMQSHPDVPLGTEESLISGEMEAVSANEPTADFAMQESPAKVQMEAAQTEESVLQPELLRTESSAPREDLQMKTPQPQEEIQARPEKPAFRTETQMRTEKPQLQAEEQMQLRNPLLQAGNNNPEEIAERKADISPVRMEAAFGEELQAKTADSYSGQESAAGEDDSQGSGKEGMLHEAVAAELPKSPGLHEMSEFRSVEQSSAGTVKTTPETFFKDVGTAIAGRLPSKNGAFTIELEPASLGRLTIKVAYEAGKAAVSIMSANPKTVELLSQSAGDIARILEEKTGQETVVYTPEPEQQYQEGQNSREHGRENQESHEQKKKEQSDSFTQMLRLGLV